MSLVVFVLCTPFFLRLYLFIFRERGKDGEREGEKQRINCNLSVPRAALSPLGHTSQGKYSLF